MKRFIVKTLLFTVLAANFVVPALAEENTVDYVDEMIKNLGENEGEIPLVIMPSPTDYEGDEPIADMKPVEESTVDYVDEMIKALGENDGEISLVIMPSPTDLEEEPIADATEEDNRAKNKPDEKGNNGSENKLDLREDNRSENKENYREYKLIIEGKPVEGKVYENSLVPVRAVAEALGYKVSWNNTDKSVTLENDELGSTMYIGENLYCTYSVNAVGMSEPEKLECAPKIIASTAYVPASFF